VFNESMTDPDEYADRSPCEDVDECTDPRFSGDGPYNGTFEGGKLCDPCPGPAGA
jgi:hypothetical protein